MAQILYSCRWTVARMRSQMICSCCLQAEEVLSQESQERTSIGDMNVKLTGLKGDIEEAQVKLQETQERIEENISRIEQLKAEAVSTAGCWGPLIVILLCLQEGIRELGGADSCYSHAGDIGANQRSF